jgi:hypothetical protein
MIAILAVVASPSCRALRAEMSVRAERERHHCAVHASRSPLRSVSATLRPGATPSRCQVAGTPPAPGAGAGESAFPWPESGRAETQPKRLQSFQRLGSGPKSAAPALGGRRTEAPRHPESPPGGGSTACPDSESHARPYLHTASSSGRRSTEGVLERPPPLQRLDAGRPWLPHTLYEGMAPPRVGAR